jgi:hypothetical protein
MFSKIQNDALRKRMLEVSEGLKQSHLYNDDWVKTGGRKRKSYKKHRRSSKSYRRSRKHSTKRSKRSTKRLSKTRRH